MSASSIEQLAAWMDDALRRDAQGVYLVPEEPPTFRVHGGLERATGDILDHADLARLAKSVFGRKRLRSLGRRASTLDARVRLPDGRYASVTAARAGGCTTMLARPIRTLDCDHHRLRVPANVVSAVESGSGLVLVTGPAGSGKTTTCYALLDHLNATRAVHIVTVGYHVDYVLEPKQALIQERQVGVDAPDMLAGIQSAVLQGADVLFVGEIRDLETLAACVRVAEIGCLVITQLHQFTPQDALERITSLQPPEMQGTFRRALAGSLRAVLAQCLLPTRDGHSIAAYGALVPDAVIRQAIIEGHALPDHACNPVLKSEIQRLADEGVVLPEAANEALSRFGA